MTQVSALPSSFIPHPSSLPRPGRRRYTAMTGTRMKDQSERMSTKRDSETDGLLVIDKPSGPTSRDVVDRVQAWFPRGTRVGHTGTLDPLASGVLVICVGRATRLVEYVQRMGKTYETTVTLGARSDTDDAEGKVEIVAGATVPSRSEIAVALKPFLGEIEQVPPAFSAANVQGRRAYALARRGHQVALEARRVRIDAIEMLAYEYPRLDLEVLCGKGTYIRSLARDLGKSLGCGALVQILRRTRVGPFRVEDAIGIDSDPAVARGRLLPPLAALADLPKIRFADLECESLRHGKRVSIPGSALSEMVLGNGSAAVAVDRNGALVGVVALELPKGVVPLKTFEQNPR